jgi:hypothetical protein
MKNPHHCPRNPLAVSASVASPGHGDETEMKMTKRSTTELTPTVEHTVAT